MITAVNVTTTAAQVVPANYYRRMLVLQNTSDVDIVLKADDSSTEVTTANGLVLSPAVIMVFTADKAGGFPHPIRAIHGGSGNKVLRVQETVFS